MLHGTMCLSCGRSPSLLHQILMSLIHACSGSTARSHHHWVNIYTQVHKKNYSVEAMSHSPYLLHKFVIYYLFDYYSVCLVYSSYRLLLLQGDYSPPAPQGCYTYTIMIIKMIEIYNQELMSRRRRRRSMQLISITIQITSRILKNKFT